MNSKIIYVLIILTIIAIAYFYRSRPSEAESFSVGELEKKSNEEKKSGETSSRIKANFFESEGKTQIAYFPYISKDEKTILVLIHGGGAHSNAGYQYIAEGLSKSHKISVYLMDLRGHGLSGDRRGDAEKIGFVYKDIRNLITIIKSRSDKPIFLCGHSSGAGIILNYISRLNTDDIAGLVFISPEFGYKSNTKRDNIKEPFARPRIWVFTLNALSGGKLFNHTTAVYLNYPPEILERDKLMINSYTTNMALSCTPDSPEEQFKKIDKPVQIIIGKNDELIDPNKVHRFIPLLDPNIRMNSGFNIINNSTHLSVLLNCESVLAAAIQKWNKI